ncbi:MAG: DUF134 domain-containing protein [Desulfobacterales bacterium]
MPRPKKPRFVSGYPTLTAFIPEGVPVTGEVFLSVEELEAIRLSDFESLDQESAANLMEVSRQTYGRILAHARSIISEALVTGKALKIEGGDYKFRGMGGRRHRGGGRGQGRESGQGAGRGQGKGRGRQF